MFIESCQVQLSSAIVANMLQYLIQSLQKHAQNMSIQLIQGMEKKKKKRKSPEFVFFQILIIHKYVHCREIIYIFFFFKKRCSAPAKSQMEMILQSE